MQYALCVGRAFSDAFAEFRDAYLYLYYTPGSLNMQPSKNLVDSLSQMSTDVLEKDMIAGGVLHETSAELDGVVADTEMNSGSRPGNEPKSTPLVKLCRALGVTPEEKTFVERMWTRLGDLGIVLEAHVRSDGHQVTLCSLQHGELLVHYKGATTHRWERYLFTQNTLSNKHALFMAKMIALYDLDQIRVAADLLTVDVCEAPSEARRYSWYRPRPPMEEME